MPLKYSSTRILHDDHMATIALLNEVERVLLSRQGAPAQDSEETTRLIGRLCKALDREISGHFDFEEASVFPLLVEFGMTDLADLLTEEHHVLRTVMNDIVARGRAVGTGEFSPEGRVAFRRLCGELIERLTSHIDKEEQALIPELEAALTPETDTELAARHDL